MKKIINLTYLFAVMMLLFGCLGEKKGHLTRIDGRKINSDGNYGDVVMITDNASIELLRAAFEKVKWNPSIVPKMPRKADVKATLFIEFDKNINIPERLYEYEIWLNENEGTATILSNNEKEGYGELDKDNTGILKSKLLSKITDWEVRNEYVESDKVLFGVYPNPALASGKPYGYIFNFIKPFETYKGKELTIYVYHKETGKRITALSPTKVTEPGPGYSSLNRFITNFELPLSGLWRYKVVLDGEIYGDVILLMKEFSS